MADVRELGGTAAEQLNAGFYDDYVPPKADAAPKPASQNVFSGLMEALNSYEQSLVPRVFEVANEYSIEFAPTDLANARVTRPGKNKAKTPFAQSDSANQRLPESQSTDYTARSWSVTAGQPIVQLIDQIMRNSSYISDQAKVTINEVTGETKAQVPLGGVAWYKINVEATPIAFDNKRQDFAYRVKYIVSAYPINNMISEYFPQGRFRGLHKSYNYWFTGQNTQILNFEQEFNKLYKQIISNPNIAIEAQRATDNREIVSRMSQANSEQSSQGAEKNTNDIGASGADYLYSPADQGNVKLKIVGDPAWLQQGEVATGVGSATKFDFSPFNADGTINFDSGEVVFDISWNRAKDYNLSTGLMDLDTKKNGDARENITYVAYECRSYFRGGSFEQELSGKLFLVPVEKNNVGAKPPGNADTGVRNTNVSKDAGGTFNSAGAKLLQDTEASAGFPYKEPKPAVPNNKAADFLNEANAQVTQPAKQAEPATSNGQVSAPTFSEATAAGQRAQNNRIAQALAGKIINNQQMAKDQ